MSLVISALNVELDDFRLENIDLEIGEGEFFALIGPTGAGKSVLLECLAGLVRARSGAIRLGGKRIDGLPPEKRDIGIVYQDYALFPHLTVAENLAYGLRYSRREKAGRQRLQELIERLGLVKLLERYPEGLSGGEQQRVALARALAVAPEVLLLDEPLSALDPGFRQELRALLKELHAATGAIFMMVTHDFTEALFLASRAAVMLNGRIEQAGASEEIFLRPASPKVAEFVGMKNLFPATASGTTARAGELEIHLPRTAAGRTWLALRPEDLVLSRAPLVSSMRNSFPGRVTAIHSQGFSYEIELATAGLTFTAAITSRAFLELNPEIGGRLYLSFKATAVHLMGI